MDCIASRIPYRQTNGFSRIILDYLDQSPPLADFYFQPPSLAGLKNAIEARRQFPTDRRLLVEELKKQYERVPASPQVLKNIDALSSPDTFTITTAHQNNIFTGPLYFIYKILHIIKLADHFNKTLPGHQFVPLFYLGTEDADLEELNHVYINGEKITWTTAQTGAVGRMKVDKELIKLVDLIAGQFSVQLHGKEMISIIRESYQEGETIEDATFKMVNHLFADKGLIIFLPDNPAFKRRMTAVFEDELFNPAASGIVEKTAAHLTESGYKPQANPRDINLFYLKDNVRERIIKKHAGAGEAAMFSIHHANLLFTANEMKEELLKHPERFSPNVILRGLYQETILPNISFVGGGGELAYWLQLKNLFNHYQTPYPVLILRNSFMIVEKKWQQQTGKLGFVAEDFFLSEQELMTRIVKRESTNKLRLNGTITETERLYESIRQQAASIDVTLEDHVQALRKKTLHRLQELEKKMLRAEKRKFSDQQRQINSIKSHLFPNNELQERNDNLLYYFAKWGRGFLDELYEHSLALEQEFVILQEK